MKTYTTKVIINGLIEVVTAAIVAALLIACYFGAVLQESYKLDPPTAQEVLNDNG